MHYEMTAADRAELAQIDADAADVKLRRKRFWAKLRQRAYRKKKAPEVQMNPGAVL